MNARKSKKLRVKARNLATTAPKLLGGWVKDKEGELSYVTARHAPGTYRRIYQDLKHAA